MSDGNEEILRAKARRTDEGGEGVNRGTSSEQAASAANTPVIISTFTSAQEREALRRALAKGRRIIQVIPQGIPLEGELLPALAAACREGRALLLSPQPSASRLNKKAATWCNEYVLRHADEIWVGDISPNGMLRAMIRGLGRDKSLVGMSCRHVRIQDFLYRLPVICKRTTPVLRCRFFETKNMLRVMKNPIDGHA